MVDFVVLNSKSLPFKSKDDFKIGIVEFLKVVKFLSEERKYYTELRIDSDFRNIFLYSNKNIQEIIGEIDIDLKRRLVSLIKNRLITIKTPIIEAEEEKNYGLLEYQYEGEESREFGYAHIFGTLLVSFLSDIKWDSLHLSLLKISLDGELSSEIKQEEIKIYNISREKYFREVEIQNFFLERIIENYSENKAIFKKVHINNDVEEKLEKIKIDNHKVYKEFIIVVHDLNFEIKTLRDYTISDESDTVKNNPKLKKERLFKFDDGSYKNIYKHMKNFSDGFRMYFEEENNKIIVCYFGPHLSTKKFK